MKFLGFFESVCQLTGSLRVVCFASTQEWETVATGYTNGRAGVTLDLLVPSHAEEVVPSHALSTAVTHALDIELHQHMQQQREELEATPEAEAVPASPFGAAASAAAGASPFSGTGPAPAAGPVAAAGVLTAARLERLAVRAKLLVAADGPMSLIRQQCVADGEPDFEVGGAGGLSESLWGAVVVLT